jgi:hypothetical protein
MSINSQHEGIMRISTVFINPDKRNGGWKLSMSFILAGVLMDGKVVTDKLVLPQQRRFKTEMTMYHDDNEPQNRGAYISKLNYLRESLDLPKIVTDSIEVILEATRDDFLGLKRNKKVPLVLMEMKVNPEIMIESIHGISHMYQWGNAVRPKPEFREIVNPQGPQQGELF